ncbi:hypothetical protein CIPAW_06G150000 [Carya illinoinensis]|uniref:WAT1-related protein n=2 Tax=Carya illinoinensis TaxID=32201 RepID=A0A8T1QBS1_CARIL|nr:hypothetical protein CIPAW_06G150000 [Carya illinoinensis]
MMGRLCNVIHSSRAGIVMVAVQMVNTGVNILFKLVAEDGAKLRILIAYRFLFASAFMVPLALISGRKNRTKLTWAILFQSFLCGLFGGVLAQNLYLESLALTSATFASAMSNLVSVITFILGILFGLERLNLERVAGKAKVLGTFMGIGGAMVLTFYKGTEIDIWSTHIDLLHHDQHQSEVRKSENHILGCILALGSCMSAASWLIIQAKMSETYQCHYITTALTCVMSAIQAVSLALCMERDWNQWKLGWNINLLTVSYSGIVASGIMVTLIVWCVHLKGPLFVSSFNPLMLVSVAILGSLVLDEKLHLGSILGAVLIVCGLYAVLWGKGKEMKEIYKLEPSESPQQSELIDIIVKSPKDVSISSSSGGGSGDTMASTGPDSLSASNAGVDGEVTHNTISS